MTCCKTGFLIGMHLFICYINIMAPVEKRFTKVSNIMNLLWFSLIESKNEISNKIAFKAILNSDRNLPRKQFRHVLQILFEYPEGTFAFVNIIDSNQQ